MTIEEYLRELRAALRVGRLRKRRILREVEEHLRESAIELGSEEKAIERFGSSAEIAERFVRPRRPILVAALAASAATTVALVGITLTGRGPDLRDTRASKIDGLRIAGVAGNPDGTITVLDDRGNVATASVCHRLHDGVACRDAYGTRVIGNGRRGGVSTAFTVTSR